MASNGQEVGRQGADGEGRAVGFETVREDELLEIQLRRERRFHRTEPVAEVRKDLVGLALSGGGIRSGAFSLGVLNALRRAKVLPFVDYLSTVSGGGYAGAYLSSEALSEQRRLSAALGSAHLEASTPLQGSNGRAGSDAPPENGSPSLDADDPLGIARGRDGRASRRLLRFIHGGQYLNQSWVFANRYLFGLLLIWTVVLSGLIAATSLTAYLFRLLDTFEFRDWMTALRFDDDLRLAFFPSFVLLILWSVAWAVSYFKYESRAHGNCARFLFYLLVATTLVAVAALLGTGEINLKSFQGAFGEMPEKETVSAVEGTVHKLIVTAILLALLPYLNPKRLFRSGTAPRNAAEKYIFWIATRALIYGTPFLLVGYFAQENISGWSAQRDATLVRGDLKWTVPGDSSSFWLQVKEEAAFRPQVKEQTASAESPPNEPERLVAGQQLSAAGTGIEKPRQTKVGTQGRLPGSKIWDFPESEEDPALAEPRNGAAGQGRRDRSLLARLFDDLQAQQTESDRLQVRSLSYDEMREQAESSSLTGADAQLSFLMRWAHCLQYLVERALNSPAAEENRLFQIAREERRKRQTSERMTAVLNRQLRRPDFHTNFEPDAIAAFYEIKEPEQPKDEWFVQLRQAIRWCEQIVAADPARSMPPGSPRYVGYTRVSADQNSDGKAAMPLVFNEARRSLDVKALEDTIGRKAAERGFDWNDLDEKDGVVQGGLISHEHWERALVAANRGLLEAYYNKDRQLIGDRSVVFSHAVLAQDQATRWAWFQWSLLAFVLSALLVDLNATSWHGYYSRQIASAWTENVPGLGREVPLAQLETAQSGRPYHLISATLQHIGPIDQARELTRRENFLFSRRYCGADRLRYAPTSEYMNGKYTLSDAVAVSGAAVSPMQADNPLAAVLLTLFNLRLGQWVPNPGYERRTLNWLYRGWRHQPMTPLQFLIGLFQGADSRAYCFVTDGGHYDNLGIEPLLRRRCRLIIASDSGQDGNYDFVDLANLIRWADVNLGVTIVAADSWQKPLDLATLMPDSANGLSREHYVIAEIHYPPDPQGGPETGYLVYLKSSLTGDEPFDLLQHRRMNGTFPHDTTADQFYDPERFLSYVALGEHVAQHVCQRQLPADWQTAGCVFSSSAEFIGAFCGIASSMPSLRTSSSANGHEPASEPAVPPVMEARLEVSMQDGTDASRVEEEPNWPLPGAGQETYIGMADEDLSRLSTIAIQHPDPAERSRAVTELTERDIHDARVVPLLIRVLGDKDSRLSQLCANTLLGDFGVDFLRSLRESSLDELEDARRRRALRRAAEIVRRYGEEWPGRETNGSAATQESVELLIPLTQHSHAGVRSRSAELLRDAFPRIRESHPQVADRLIGVLVFYYMSEKQISPRQRQLWKTFWRGLGVRLS